MNQLVPTTALCLPALVSAAGDRAGGRFLEFFTANIRNPHTRRAYSRAVADFLAWCESVGVPSIAGVQPLHIATWTEAQSRERAAPTVKQQLAALRHLFDWLVVGQVVPVNPAASVRGPSHLVKSGKTPVLEPAEARTLLDSIDVPTPAGLRDRALIGLMVYSFARIGAALAMKVEDVFTQNRRLSVRLREKGGKRHEMPCHHNLEEYLAAYLDDAGLRDDPKGPLFRTIGRGTGQLTRTALPQANAYAMIRRRAAAAGIATKIGNHTFRATGITAYLKNGGTLEKAAAMANHASTRTMQLYDRRRDEMSLDEVERAYKATAAGSPDATVGNTLAALAELTKKGRAYPRAVRRLADDRSGVDYTTHGILQPLAKAVLAHAPGAREALARAAAARAEELRQHKRVDTRTEPLRFFCGVLRLIFNRAAPLALRGTIEESWHHCRAFAMEVFTTAGITPADFEAHPERLTEYLGTDVSID